MFERIGLVVVLGVLAAGILARANADEAAGPMAPELKVIVDPRVELLTAVQDLAGYGESMGLLTRLEFAYTTR